VVAGAALVLADLLRIPLDRMDPEVLSAMLEEYASRDGTDYGAQELSLEEKVARLRALLHADKLAIVYDGDSEHWDLLPEEQLARLDL
jgi:uncharacterized protein YheU (UPF0270 family)